MLCLHTADLIFWWHIKWIRYRLNPIPTDCGRNFVFHSLHSSRIYFLKTSSDFNIAGLKYLLFSLHAAEFISWRRIKWLQYCGSAVLVSFVVFTDNILHPRDTLLESGYCLAKHRRPCIRYFLSEDMIYDWAVLCVCCVGMQCALSRIDLLRTWFVTVVQFASKRIESLFDLHICGLMYFFAV